MHNKIPVGTLVLLYNQVFSNFWWQVCPVKVRDVSVSLGIPSLSISSFSLLFYFLPCTFPSIKSCSILFGLTLCAKEPSLCSNSIVSKEHLGCIRSSACLFFCVSCFCPVRFFVIYTLHLIYICIVSVLDPCQSLSCLNGAACTALDCSTRQCQCTDCFQGDNCGTSKCPVTNITL